MHLISILGHSLILLPASIALIAVLVTAHARRDALAFAVALVVCLTGTLGAKLAFEACRWGVSGLGIESPSGHASLSALVYGALAVLLATERPAGRQALIFIGAFALILLIGLSRVAVEAHTPEEVVAGLLIGGVCVLIFAALRGRPKHLIVPWRALFLMSPFALALVLSVLFRGGRWTPEPLIDAVARRIGAHFGLCA
ncbi:MAG TPA: phosphatase PAP2 family protein [Roseiarcus sp.]|nr:phosphatase PAP2 family protein [Roseiarcus sp.]